MKYYIEMIDIKSGDEHRIGCTEDRAEATSIARHEWNTLCCKDKKRNKIEVRIYAEDIEGDDCDCFDYDLINWRLTPSIIDVSDMDFDAWRISAVWNDGTTVDNDMHERTGSALGEINEELAESEEWFWDRDPAEFLVNFYDGGEWVDYIRISR